MERETSTPSHGATVLRTRELATLVAGLALAVVPNLPFVVTDGMFYGRIRNWSIFVAGLLIGAVLTGAQGRLPSGTGARR